MPVSSNPSPSASSRRLPPPFPPPPFRQVLGRSLLSAIFAAILLVSLVLSLGCEPSTRSTQGGNPGTTASGGKGNKAKGGATDEADGVWPFWPTQMRIHPLTRFVSDPTTKHRVIEARIEFRDLENCTSKASGRLSIRLFPAAAPGSAASRSAADRNTVQDDSAALETWNQDLRQPDVNRRQYDDVTRTYLFRLEFDPARLTDAPELRVTFLSADGRTLNASLVLKP